MNSPQWFADLIAEYRDDPPRLWAKLFEHRIELERSWTPLRNAIPIWEQWPWVGTEDRIGEYRRRAWDQRERGLTTDEQAEIRKRFPTII